MFGGHRLPGVAFETVLTPAPEALPPMDVALFAGFAAMGPVHLPVEVEDFAGFRRTFGDACPLAFDPATGETVNTALAPAVRAFFANGGRRCWIIRIARTEELERLRRGRSGLPLSDDVASAAWFDLAGLVAVERNGQLGSARAQARSLGSWSDGLSVAARVERRPFSYRDLRSHGDALTFTTGLQLELGDLIELKDAAATHFAWIGAIEGRRASARLLPWILPNPPEASPPETSPPTASPPQSPPEDLLEGRMTPPGPDFACARVRLELRVDDRTDSVALGGIGLTSAHPQSWWSHLPDDRPEDGFTAVLPIAAIEEPFRDVELGSTLPPLVWLPVGLTGTYSKPVSASHDDRTELQRDGLSRFGADLFLDPRLAEVGSRRVLEEAERILHLEGRPLFGIHAVLGIDEGAQFNPVSLLAVPDASQPGWTMRERVLPPQATSESSPPAHWFDHRGPCAAVAAEAAEATDLDRSRFLDCATRKLTTPVFEPLGPDLKRGAQVVRWSAVDGAAAYRLEVARNSGLDGAEVIYEGPELFRAVDLLSEGFYYFRLRARAGDEVSAPALLAVSVRASDWEVLSPRDYRPDALLSVQRALLRLSCATGEMFALLSLPRHYRAADAVDHARSIADPIAVNEQRALSFGAVHHPWTISIASGEAGLIAAPPEGAIAGVHARRTLQRGAWIAAANERLRDVVALEPSITDLDWPLCDINRVNLLRRDPRGFLLLDSDTLSDEPEWRQINVRRLMSLLRRLAIRRGSSYVFEPNGDVLRRAVERGFTELLERMFRLGAFAGRKASEAYRLAVATTQADRDAGRLVVEIGVAPSVPMRFLTVRLVQAGGRFSVEEG